MTVQNTITGSRRAVQTSVGTGVIVDTTTPVTLRNNTIQANSVRRLDKLVDVDASVETLGSTLVYDQSLDKYVVKQMDIQYVTGNLDGGQF